ncbi:MAG: nucleotidyltransferase domain-containing protein [Desulfurobacteriaceae bacterium]
MRLSKEVAEFLKKEIKKFLPDAEIYLFGSRVYKDKRGGDIDILVIGERKLSLMEKVKIRVAFFKRFGEQKIDIISFSRDEKSTFKEFALKEGVKL